MPLSSLAVEVALDDRSSSAGSRSSKGDGQSSISSELPRPPDQSIVLSLSDEENSIAFKDDDYSGSSSAKSVQTGDAVEMGFIQEPVAPYRYGYDIFSDEEPVLFEKDEPSREWWRVLRFNSVSFWFCVVLAVGMIAAGLWYLLSGKNLPGQTTPARDNIFEKQSFDPTLVTPQVSALQEMLTSESSSEDLSDPNSDQYAAMKWLAEEDPAERDFDAASPQEVKDRYRAALVYFSLNKGGEWRQQHGFLSADHICDWNNGVEGYAFEGIRCEKGEVVEMTLNINRLSGTIPTEIASFNNLETLDLGSNSVTGTIPSELAQLTELKTLKLGSNELGGELPSELGGLVSLQTFVIYGNHLEGTVPSSYSSLVNLENLHIEGTKIGGEVDSTFCNRNDSFENFYASCGADGEITSCSCCTYCCDGKGTSCRGMM